MSMLLVEAGQSGLCIYDERVRRISTGHRCRSRPRPFVVRMRRRKAPPRPQEARVMKYLFALIGDQSRSAEATPEERRAAMQAWDGYTREAIDAGVYLG